MAAFVMQYTDSVGNATKPACEQMLMIRPRFCLIIILPTACDVKKVPLRFTFSVSSKSFSVTLSAGFGAPMPALFTRISIRLKYLNPACTAAETSSILLTSSCTGKTFRPIF